MTTPDAQGDPVFAPPSPRGPEPDISALELPPPPVPTSPAPAAPDPARVARARAVRRRALLLSGAVVAVAVVVAGVALGVQSARDRRWAPVDADLTAPTRAAAVQLVLGSCVADLPDGELRQLRVVPCAEEHRAQVVGRTDAAGDAVWPGTDGVATRAARVCGPQMLAGEEPEGLTYVVVTPTEDGWAAGDRTSLCLAVAPADAPLGASLLG